MSTRKVVINACCGKFSLSHEAFVRLRERGQPDALIEPDTGRYWPAAYGPKEPSLNQYGALIPRDDERLVKVVEELGAEANGHCAELKIVEIPGDIEWEVEGLHGREWVSEAHRTWR
ncbi:hypothetical protein [Candidatus Nitrospira bockiana]